jgi:hypothetical protein
MLCVGCSSQVTNDRQQQHQNDLHSINFQIVIVVTNLKAKIKHPSSAEQRQYTNSSEPNSLYRAHKQNFCTDIVILFTSGSHRLSQQPTSGWRIETAAP